MIGQLVLLLVYDTLLVFCRASCAVFAAFMRPCGSVKDLKIFVQLMAQ